MIKVSFRSTNAVDDVRKILENVLTNQTDIEKWLMEQVHTIEFDCMDFPHDLEAFYDCYFTSKQERQDANRIYRLLGCGLESIEQVLFSVYLVDEQMKQMVEIIS